MSVFNGENHLYKAIKSILNQTYESFEFIIINDGSTDSSKSIIESFDDERIILINQDNAGLTPSLNIGINVAIGMYIARMDADDISHPSRLEKQLKYIQDNQLDLVWAKAKFIDEGGKLICNKFQPSLKNTMKYLHKFIYIVHPATLFKKSAILDSGLYNEEFLSGQDGDLWRRMNSKGYSFGLVNEYLLDYRVTGISISAQNYNYSKNINYRNAKICLQNFEYKQFLHYFMIIGDFYLTMSLLFRLIISEFLILIIRYFLPNNYNRIHKVSEFKVS